MMRRLVVLPLAALAVLAAPGPASADVIFDQADADELATTLGEAYETQDVCYGWSIDVDNEGLPERSVGSNFGAGQSIQDSGSSCAKSVEFQASITWTSESSESEDSASYQVISQPSGPSTSDLDDLELISEDGLIGDGVDADVYKAVAALPLLAADAGLADPIEASPAPEADAGDAAPTDSPGSDFWRQSGMLVLWGSLLLVAGVVFAVYAVRSSRRPARRMATVGPPEEQIPEYVPPEWSGATEEPPTAPATTQPDPAEPETGSASAQPEPDSAEPEADSGPVKPATGSVSAEPEPDSAEPEADSGPVKPESGSASAQRGPSYVEPEADSGPVQPKTSPAEPAEKPADPAEKPVAKPATKSDPEPRPDE
jgi:hypothetical protein